MCVQNTCNAFCYNHSYSNKEKMISEISVWICIPSVVWKIYLKKVDIMTYFYGFVIESVEFCNKIRAN